MFKKISHQYALFPVTTLLIGCSTVLSIITWFGYVPSLLVWFIYDEHSIMSGQVWRLVTPIFLHFPAFGIVFAHLAFNMIWLYMFGRDIERFESSRFLLVLVFVSAVITNVAQGAFSESIFGGMSGVVYALLGYLFLRGKLSYSYPVRVPDNIAYFLIGFMLLAATGLFGAGIANVAHIGGFIVGLLFAYVRTIR